MRLFISHCLKLFMALTVCWFLASCNGSACVAPDCRRGPPGCMLLFFFCLLRCAALFRGQIKVTKKIVMRKPGLEMSVGSTQFKLYSGRLVSLLVGNIDPVPIVIIASYLISKASITHPRIDRPWICVIACITIQNTSTIPEEPQQKPCLSLLTISSLPTLP